MRVCTFFGHREAPEEIKRKLSSAIEDLIVNHAVDTFYMGCEGKFDAYARAAVKVLDIKLKYNTSAENSHGCRV